jgi:hypothetical protein
MHGHCERHLSREVFALDHDEIGFNAVESLLTFDAGIEAMAAHPLRSRGHVRLYAEQRKNSPVLRVKKSAEFALFLR